MALTSCRNNEIVSNASLMMLLAIGGLFCAQSAEASCAVGEKVEARYAKTGVYYGAVIESFNQDGTLTVNWNDGDPLYRTIEVEQARRGSMSCKQGSPFTIPIKRTRVPIKRKGRIVSHKCTYSGSIAVGSPLQHFSVVFDTGSGHVVLPGSDCMSEACLVHNRYNRSQSAGAVDINIDKSPMKVGEAYDEITVRYGTGQIVGTLVDEKVCLGNVCTRMGIIKATELSRNPFTYFPVDGIFGMGLGSLALDPDFSFFSTVTQRSGFHVAQFAMYLGENDDDSELTVGGYNKERMQSPVMWAPIANPEEGHWMVNLKAIHIGDHVLELCKDGSCRAILDTGSSHLGLPSATERLLEDLLSVPAEQSDNCLHSEGKTINFELETFNLTLSTANYMRKLPLDDRIVKSGDVAPAIQAKEEPDMTKVFSVGEAVEMFVKHPDGKSLWYTAEILAKTESSNVSMYKVRRDFDQKEYHNVSAEWLQKSVANQSTRISTGLTANDYFDENAETHIWCRPLLMPVNLPEPLGSKLFILGEPLLRKYYTIFDANPAQLGFGLAKEKPKPVEEDTIFLMQETARRDRKSGVALVQVTIVAVKRAPAKIRQEDIGTRVTVL